MPDLRFLLTLLFILIYMLALYSCYRVLRKPQNPSATIAWVLINLLLPWVGVPLYYLLGENRIEKFVKRKRRSQKEFVDKRHPKYPEIEPGTFASLSFTEFSSAQIFDRLLSPYGQIFKAHTNSVRLLIDGTDTFDEIFRALKLANNYVLV